jgi:predicted permease
MLTESLLLGLLAGVGGIFIGAAGAQALRSFPLQTELPVVMDFRLDWRVFAYTLAAALSAGILMGIGSALRSGRGNVSAGLHESSRAFAGGRQRLRSWLVVVQVGGSLALLIAAGLFVRSLRRAEHVDLGFNPQQVLNLTVNPHQLGYTTAQEKNFYAQLLDQARALPGVKSASLAMAVPLGEVVDDVAVDIPGYQPSKDESEPSALFNDVSTQFFETLQMKLVSGRDFDDRDTENSTPVAIVNQAMADHFWPHQDVIGKSFTLSWKPKRTVQIVGIVRNAHTVELTSPFQPTVYLPLTQHSADAVTLQVRSEGDPLSLLAPIRQVITGLDSAMPISSVQTMEAQTGNTMNGLFLFEVAAGLAGGLGLLGLILAVVGVYGVISYSVSQRTQEIGIRMALGATASEILRMISRQSFLIIAASVPLGLLAAFTVGKLLTDFLVGVSPTDPLTYAAVTALLVAVALAAGYLPARRATRVNPMVALRHE